MQVSAAGRAASRSAPNGPGPRPTIRPCAIGVDRGSGVTFVHYGAHK